jgi:hypothetical protein
VWSIGVLYFQMLVGVCPFDANDLDVLATLLEEGHWSVPASKNLSAESIRFLS